MIRAERKKFSRLSVITKTLAKHGCFEVPAGNQPKGAIFVDAPATLTPEARHAQALACVRALRALGQVA
jgi:hypothetical protein